MNDVYKKAHQIWDKQHQVGSPTYYLRKSLLTKRIKQFIKNNDEVLDFGCGTGDYLLEMVKYQVKLNGVDLSDYAINQAKLRLKDKAVDLRVGSIDDFEPDKKYDFILVSEVLEHIQDDQAALEKIAGWLNPQGRIIISVPFDPSLWKYESHQPYDDLRRYSKNDLTSLVNKAGLRVLNLDCYGFPFLRLYYYLTRPLRKKSAPSSLAKKGLLVRLIFGIFKIIVNFDKLFLSTNKGVGLILIAKNE